MINKILTLLTLPVLLIGGQGGTTRTTIKHAEEVTATTTTDESLNNWAIKYVDGTTLQTKSTNFATSYEKYSTLDVVDFSFIDSPNQHIQLLIDNYFDYVRSFTKVYRDKADRYPGVISIDMGECPALKEYFDVHFDLSGNVYSDYYIWSSDSVLFINTNVFANKGIESPNDNEFNLYFREPGLSYNTESFETARELQDLISTWEELKIDFYKPKLATHINNKPFITDKAVDLYIDTANYYTTDQILSQVDCVDIFQNDCDLTLVSSDLKNVAGTYTIVATATDSYGMTATLTINVTVVDYTPTIRPIEGATNRVTINYSSIVTSADVLALYTATDYFGEPLEVSFKLGTKLNTSKIGESTYTLVAKYAQNHTSEYQITVNVVNDVPPLILLSDSIIFCDVKHPFNLVELKQAIIMSSGLKADEVAKVEIKEPSEAIKNLSKVGKYSINYTIETKDGQVRTGVLKTNVVEPVAKKTWWDSVCEWFQKLWNWICGKGWTL